MPLSRTEFWDRCDEVLTLSRWYMASNKWAKQTAMQNGGLRAVSHDVWLGLVTSKQPSNDVAFSTAVCKRTQWTLHSYSVKKRITIDSDAEVPEQLYETEYSNVENWRDTILDLLRYLSYRERHIIRLRYGIDDGCSMTWEQIGRVFKVTKERIRQLDSVAIKKLQIKAEPLLKQWEDTHS